MDDYPDFMKSPKNRIRGSSQYTEGIEGYVFDGADGSQMAFWICKQDRKSSEHVHDYDEYLVVVKGNYRVGMNGRVFELTPGMELHIPSGVPHDGEAIAGTRTIHCFGGLRALREG